MTLFKEAKKEEVKITVERLKNKVYVVIAQKGNITKEAIWIMPKKTQMDEFEYRIQMVALEISSKGIEITEQQVLDVIKKNAHKLYIHLPKKEET